MVEEEIVNLKDGKFTVLDKGRRPYYLILIMSSNIRWEMAF